MWWNDLWLCRYLTRAACEGVVLGKDLGRFAVVLLVVVRLPVSFKIRVKFYSRAKPSSCQAVNLPRGSPGGTLSLRGIP